MSGLNGAASVGLIAMVALTGCSKDDFFGPGPDEALPENHPPAVGSAGMSLIPPTWSANGHLAYVLPDLLTAVDRPGGTGPVRVLHTVAAPAQLIAVALSPDASEWYTVTNENGAGVLRWHHDGIAEVLTDHARGFGIGPKNGRGVVVAANGDVAFIARPDSLFIKRGDAAPRFVAPGCGAIAAVSPAGDGVICYHPDPFSDLLRFAMDGTGTTVAGSRTDGRVTSVQWTAQGVHLLYSFVLSGFAAERESDPQSMFLTPGVEYPESASLDAVLAADGRSFVYANNYCAKTSGFFGCDHNQTLLYHVDLVKRTTKRVVVHTSSDGIGLSISPDGRRIAYTLGGHLFVVHVN